MSRYLQNRSPTAMFGYQPVLRRSSLSGADTAFDCPVDFKLERTTIYGGSGDTQKNRLLAKFSGQYSTKSKARVTCLQLSKPQINSACSGSQGPGCARGIECSSGAVLETTNVFHSSPKARLAVQSFAQRGVDSGWTGTNYTCIKMTKPNLPDAVAQSSSGGSSSSSSSSGGSGVNYGDLARTAGQVANVATQVCNAAGLCTTVQPGAAIPQGYAAPEQYGNSYGVEEPKSVWPWVAGGIGALLAVGGGVLIYKKKQAAAKLK